MKETFNVTNVSCQICVQTIESKISKLEGVKCVQVNLLKKVMIVDYDDKIISNDEICNEVKKLGYGAFKYEESIHDKLYDNEKTRLILSVCLLIPLMYLSNANMFSLPTFGNFYIDSLIAMFLAIEIAFINIKYYINGFKSLFKLSPSMDTLIACSSLAAIFYGIIIIIFKLFKVDISDEVNAFYFESAGMVLTLITLGKFLEAKQKAKTTSELNSLLDLTPEIANLVIDEKGNTKEIKSQDIKIGDVLAVKQGDIIPIDGIIIKGGASIDESILTGESIPVDKLVNDYVYKATTNKNGYIFVEATTNATDTKYDELVELVNEASMSKAKISRSVDIICKFFVPTIMLLSVITFFLWLFITKYDVSFSITLAISVLVVSCPCALGLATPTAIMVSTGIAAKNYILVKNAESLEELSKIDTILFDKTGTLTEGKILINEILPFNMEYQDFVNMIVALEKKSSHPISKPFYDLPTTKDIEIANYREKHGLGIKGEVNKKVFVAGSLKMLDAYNINYDPTLKSILDKAIFFGYNKEFIGYVTIKDTIKESSKPAINSLKKMGIDLGIISGDTEYQTMITAKSLGIYNYYYEVLPEDKEKILTEYINKGKKVAFVGDGVNDSIALSKATIGIAIGSGTNVAMESANIVLSRNNLNDIVFAINLSKQTLRIIIQNLFWAFFYNILLIPISMGLFSKYGFYMKPSYGAFAMCLSSIIVVTNALRLRKFGIEKEGKNMFGKKAKDSKINIEVHGLNCSHCEANVEKVLKELPGVVSVKASAKKSLVVIENTDELDIELVKLEINKAGYSFIKVK